MRQRSRNLNACIGYLQRLQACGALDHGQKEELARAERKLRRVGRSNRITQEEVFEVVRSIAETLCETFLNRQASN